MPFFAIQKKPLFNRGFHREILKVAIFDPPREIPRNPQNCHFWPLFGPQKTPKNPKNPQNGQNSRKWPFLTKFAFLAKNYEDLISKTPLFDPPLGDSPPPQKWPFLTPPGKTPKNPRFWRFLAIFWSKSVNVNGFQPPWPDFLYLIIGLLGRKFGICAENEDFLHPATGAGCEWSGVSGIIPRLLPRF